MRLLDELRVIKAILCKESNFPDTFNPLSASTRYSPKELLNSVLLDKGVIRDEEYYLVTYKDRGMELDAYGYSGETQLATLVSNERVDSILSSGVSPSKSPYARVLPIELFNEIELNKGSNTILSVDLSLLNNGSLVTSHGIIFAESFPKECFSIFKEDAE